MLDITSYLLLILENREVQQNQNDEQTSNLENFFPSSQIRISETAEGFRCYCCPYCSYESRAGAAHVQRHMMYKHTGEKPFGCTVCPKRFVDKNSFERHMRIHTGSKPFQCHICLKKFSQRCTACASNDNRGQRSILPSNVVARTVENYGSRLHCCPFCPYKSYVMTNVKTHIKYKHTGEKPFSCSVCQKSFTEKSKLNRHYQTHRSEEGFICHICLRRFAEETEVKDHINNCHK
ncbi:Zinc finger protein 2 [Armadillidium nasatum]|uniref:Zinc finger protein 2 n=1 Tax=Armadillidium nasatum TaxID=96803 RepID=A0A5N5SZS1_9CRUS|nr:Zinc finger protein 2 [Armadillidium nasatum]